AARWTNRRQGAAIHVGRAFRDVPVRRAARSGNFGQRRGRGSRDALGLWLGIGAVRNAGRSRSESLRRTSAERRSGDSTGDRESAFERKQGLLRVGKRNEDRFRYLQGRREEGRRAKMRYYAVS